MSKVLNWKISKGKLISGKYEISEYDIKKLPANTPLSIRYHYSDKLVVRHNNVAIGFTNSMKKAKQIAKDHFLKIGHII